MTEHRAEARAARAGNGGDCVMTDHDHLSEMFARLAAPFPVDRVSWRVGSTNAEKTRGMALAYVDARDVQDRLNEVLTPAGWECEYTPMSDKTKCCAITIHVPGIGARRKANGAGETDYEAEKGAFSDAFKRAAVLWGVGRYLYDLGSPWVEIEQRGKSFIIMKHEYPKLSALLERNGEPPKSARQACSDGDYQRIEFLLRNAKTERALSTAWRNEQKVIAQWPDQWRTAITEEKDRCKAALKEPASA